MSNITNYNTLVQALKDEAEDDGVEFTSFIPTAIALAEDRLFKELILDELETKIEGTLTTNNNLVSKPNGYEYTIHFAISDSTTKRILKKKRESFLVDYWPIESLTGYPKYYCDYSKDFFKVAPTPQINYAYELRYMKKPVRLSSTTSTNYYIDKCPDVLFKACMVEMVKFMKGFKQLPIWEENYKVAKDSWNSLKMPLRTRQDSYI